MCFIAFVLRDSTIISYICFCFSFRQTEYEFSHKMTVDAFHSQMLNFKRSHDPKSNQYTDRLSEKVNNFHTFGFLVCKK